MNEQIEQTLGVDFAQLWLCAAQTIYMIGWSLLIGTLIALILAVIVVFTRPQGIKENAFVYTVTNGIVNIFRSIPFVILLVFIAPVTKIIIGTRIGTEAALVPLVVFIAPYLTRLIENSLLEVQPGILEAAQAMGANAWQTFWRFLLPEALPSLILALTTGTISLLGATAMAGVIGGGGVGDLALTYGYERFNNLLMLVTVIVLVVFVQLIQAIGNGLARRVRGEN